MIPFHIIIAHFFVCWTSLIHCQYYAIACVPVADLVNAQNHLAKSKKDLFNDYKNIPCAGTLPQERLNRLHQLLFHEIVYVKQEKGLEIQISIPNVFYENQKSGSKENSYWTLKKYIIPLKELTLNNQNINNLPTPISFEQKTNPDQTILTLSKPHYCKELDLTFSAGTRFVKADKDCQKMYSVFALNPHLKKISIIFLPKKICINASSLTKDEKINHFISILKNWANARDGVIPYVWGGCSFLYRCKDTFITQSRQTCTWHDRVKEFDTHAGFDCTGMIARAAQIVGMPYFFKNSSTIIRYISPLKKNQSLSAGDIIWFPGHVMVVADLINNTLIEARAYDQRYGKIQEIPLDEIFLNVHTYQDLIHAYQEKESLKRLDNQKKVVQTIKEIKILKLTSIWHNT